nr:hypothetical protein [Stenotrophomonas maltophilia]
MIEEAINVRRPHLLRVMTQRQSDLQPGRVLRDPADVARRVALADKAMQRIALRHLQAGELTFDAVEIVAHLAEPGALGNA